MANDSAITLPQSTYSIQEAASLIGKSDQTVRRYVKDGRFPGVEMVAGDKGDEYRIPSADLCQLIEAKKLVINLDQSTDQSASTSADHLAELIEAREAVGNLTSQVVGLTNQVANLTNDRDLMTAERNELRRELDSERTHHAETSRQLAESDKAKAVAQALVDELREHVEQTTEQRDSLIESMRTLEESRTESISALYTELDAITSNAERVARARRSLDHSRRG